MIPRILLVTLALIANPAAGSDDSAGEDHCTVTSAANSLPDAIAQIRLGMAYSEIVKILGEPDYSPAEGQYYHSTGGYCFTDGGPGAACGFVLEYRVIVYGTGEGISATLPNSQEDYRLQGCSWGGISE